ncbi:MAG: TonB-dependent receptor, partial [Bacteroidota bacterium]
VKTNGQQVFGYFNLDRIYTRGVEAEATVLPLDALSLADSDHRVEVAVGYQFLQARDRDVIDALESGTVFGRDLNNRDVQLGVDDYAGLFGRSPHSATLRATYEHADLGLTTSLRARYRSEYGFADFDGNQIANRPDEFVSGYGIVDATVTKTVPAPGDTQAALQLGIDNAFDVTRGALVPSLPGRRFYATLRLSL